MVTKSEAIRTARAELVAGRRSWAGSDWPELEITHIDELSRCWVVYYDSRDHLQSGNLADAVPGNAPFLIDRARGQLFVTGTAEPIETYVEAFLTWGDPHGPPPLRQEHYALLGLIAGGSGPRSTRTLAVYARGEAWAGDVEGLIDDLQRRGLIDDDQGRWAVTDAGRRAAARD